MVKCFEGLNHSCIRQGRLKKLKINILGTSVDGFTIEQFVERITFHIENRESCFVVTLNPELLYRAQKEKELLTMLNRADLVTADGVGIVWACRVSGRPVPERVTGIDLMLRLLELAALKGWRVFFLGSEQGVALIAAEQAAGLFPGLQVVGTHHGFFSENESHDVISKIISASPHLLFVSLGSPRQEVWIEKNSNLLGNIVAMGVGGSLDVLSGNVRRVPPWIRRLNLEWLGRLLVNPGRWKRMLVLPKFVFMVWMAHKFQKFFVRGNRGT